MDHHCILLLLKRNTSDLLNLLGIWINQCVGYFNHKLFVTFLFYTNVGMIYFLTLLLLRVLFVCLSLVITSSLSLEYMRNFTNMLEESMTAIHAILMALNIISVIFVLGGTIVLFCQQISLMARNLTNIELWLKHWATTDYSTNGRVCACNDLINQILSNHSGV
jgi:hypothetical protein